uniref:hypothetical protein n=1 Tax=Prevotella sp. TaxID=59823 RepID=UPI0040291FFD
MMIQIANPIYDSVFKYLMEDERIAKTLLSALLKKEVVAVEMRRNEYTNGVRDNISMFRIDFGAHVKEPDGTIRLVLIELQKTWLETETLRFRQYLGAQYSNPENVPSEKNNDGYAIPMVAIYLLGHRVGDINVPVLYVKHKAYDYDGNVVTDGIPDPFVESLIHDSIIVQIPLLHGQVNNRLEKVLSVFDQSQKNGSDRHVLNVNDTPFDDDDDMQYLLRRLLMAAANAQLRQEMNVEDEYFKALEDRDTALMMKDKKLAEQAEQLEQNKAELEQNKAQLRTMALLLSNSGMSVEEIAKSVGMSQDQVKLLLNK